MKKTLSLLAALLFLSAMPAIAGPDETLSRWYAALQASDEPAISALLSDNAVILLEDIGIEQTKAEFVASLGEWRDAINGGTVEFKLEAAEGDGATTLVCYRFPDSPMTVREVFTFTGEQIAKSVQAQVADNCDGF